MSVKGRGYSLKAIARKRGIVAYHYLAQPGEEVPDHPTRQKIAKSLARQVRERIMISCPPDRTARSGEPFIQKLERIVFTLEEEVDVTIVDSTSRVRAAFDVEKVARRFYDRFKKERKASLGFIDGIEALADREWYASLMCNRMMFIDFVRKRGFLNDNVSYLRDRLETVRRRHGEDKSAGFYRIFLLKQFHDGLGQPEAERSPK